MDSENRLHALIDGIYEAVLDDGLWPGVLIRLADAMGAAQISMPSFDWRANVFSTIAPRTDPVLLASFKDYWAYNEPIVPLAALRPAGEVYTLDNLMPIMDFSATPVFNEWWRPAGYGVAAIGANLVVQNQFSASLVIFNAPGKQDLPAGQTRLFAAVLPHVIQAVRIHRQLSVQEIKQTATPERFESLPRAALLVDASARLVHANSAGVAMLDARDGLFLDNGRLAAGRGTNVLHRLIGTCARTSLALGGPGGELKVPREPGRTPLLAIVTPLRSKTRLVEFPWTGMGVPVAMVTASDPDIGRRREEVNLHRRFGLTTAEAGLATEIVKGDGRIAAARRRGISNSTARTQLSSIFEKTGVHRQAELVRLLLDAAAGNPADT